MKRKIGMLVLTLTLAAGLTACGNSTTEASPTPSAPAVEPTSSPSANPGGVVGQAGDYGRARGGDAWMGDNAMDNAYDVIRGAVDGTEDKVQGFLDGMEDSARDAGRDMRRVGDEIYSAMH